MELHDRELVQLFGLLIGVGALLFLAPVARVPYPIFMVLGGLVLSFVPGLPEFDLPPELVLVAFLPPLLYSAAFFTSLRDLRANLYPISLLSIGLVAATTVGVALVAHAVVDELPWSAAFVLGAVVSPTDPLAATSISRRLGAPRRIVAIVEGESLVNDATALVLYRVAVVAVLTGGFTLWEAGARLVVNAIAGIAIGLVVGYVIRQVRRRMNDPPSEIAIAFLTGYLAYLPAEALGVSAVLAAVTAGIYLGWFTPELTNAETRLQGFAFWTILVFILNAALFTLVGLQLPSVLDGLGAWSTQELVVAAAAVCATVVIVRLAWVAFFAYLQRRTLVFRNAMVVGWAGMRGAVSLAAALAIPLETDAGAPFPGRELIIFLAFCVIVVTLVGEGATLPAVIRGLGVEDDGGEAREEAKARKRASMAALERLAELEGEDWVMDDTAGRLRGLYDFRVRRFGERFDDSSDGANEAQSLSYQRLRRELLDAERDAVLGLRREGVVSDDVMNRVLRDIALEDVRLDFER
jgi:CPA1 family monovalent cation:H+ antiporter